MSTHVFVRYVSIIFSKALKTISIYLTLFSSFSIKVRILSTHYFGNVWKVSKLVPWKENGRKWSNTQENILLKKQLKKSHFYRRQFSISILGYYHHLKTKEKNSMQKLMVSIICKFSNCIYWQRSIYTYGYIYMYSFDTKMK